MVVFNSCTKQLPSIRVYSMDEGDFAKTFPQINGVHNGVNREYDCVALANVVP